MLYIGSLFLKSKEGYMNYHISKTVNKSFENTIESIKSELEKEGFGVLSEINMDEKFRAKLNVDYHRYVILGACNPHYAYRAVQADDKIGTMLPCNIIVQEISEEKVEVSAINPIASMLAVENKAIEKIAGDIKEKLEHVIEVL